MSNTLISSASAPGTFSTNTSDLDPYVYQVGFGNRFATEAIPGTLPQGRNNPQKAKYGLYQEQLTGTAFVAPRSQNEYVWMYRIRPSVAHDGFSKGPELPDLEHNFLDNNPKVSVNPAHITWNPLAMPSRPTEFIEGIKTIAGAGVSSLREGLAIHMYAANTSMKKRAFVNTDGDFLIVPVQGRLDIQTEFGKLMVKVGEIAVIQRGIRFKIDLPDGPSRGYMQEIYGVHYELPELGPLGSNGLAYPRDFESPVAYFDIDQTSWEVVHKVSGTLHTMKQQHTPFDVVAWHGNYVPFKYDLHKFVRVGSISHDHIDPSIFCVLTARSKYPGTPLADFLVFAPRWDVSEQTFRPPYFHRNTASEFVGMIYGKHGPPREGFAAGSGHLVSPFAPHGLSTENYKVASEMILQPMRVHEDTMLIMFESSMAFSLTEFASRSLGKTAREGDPKVWEGLKGSFIDQLGEVNRDLRALGLQELNKPL